MKNFLLQEDEATPEKSLSRDQLLKYAKDISKLYHRELEYRKELERVNRELQTEILQRTQLQTELGESEKKYRSLFDDSFDAIFITARDGQLLDANGAYWDLFGYEKAELLGQSVLITYADPPRRSAFQKAIEETGAVRNFPIRAKKKNGAVLDCLISAVVRSNPDGNILGYQGIIRDVTERKRSQEILELAKRMEALAHMAGGIAHEIRNPLAISSSATQLLLNERTPTDLRNECVEKVISGINRASHIIENLLTFARPLTDYVIGEVDLPAVMLLTLKEIKLPATRQGIDISTQIGQSRMSLIGNTELLHRAFLNLFFNALAAMPHGGILRVNVHASGAYGIVTVADSGKGIPEDKLPRIFDPFFPGFSASEGIGLGLSVAYTIVTKHGGMMQVDSVPGRGATFTVSLPLITHPA